MKPDNYRVSSTDYYNGFTIEFCKPLDVDFVPGQSFYLVNGEHVTDWLGVLALVKPKPEVEYEYVTSSLQYYASSEEPFDIVGVLFRSVVSGWTAVYKTKLLVEECSFDEAAAELKKAVEKDYKIL